jgi:type II secretory pathway component PulM
MEENRDMQVWLAPVQGTRLLVPLRIAVRTMIGMSVVEASQWALSATAKVVPTSGETIKAGAAQ